MKILITGATGFIGNQLLKRLLQMGYEVNALCRDTISRELMEHPQLNWMEGDLLNIKSIQQAIKHCDIVFHTAGYVRVWHKWNEIYFKENVQGTENMLSCAADAGVKKFIFTSTGSIFSSSVNTTTEDSLRLSDFTNPYEASKFLAEERVKTYALRGLNTCTLNPCRVYGPGTLSRSNGPTKMMINWINAPIGLIPEDNDTVASYVYIDDVINGHINAMNEGKAGERYILGGENVNYSTFYNTLAEVSGISKVNFSIPFAFIKAFAFYQLIRAKLSGFEPWITPSFLSKNLLSRAMSSQKAIDELNYSITPLRTGMETTLHWLQQERIIKLNTNLSPKTI